MKKNIYLLFLLSILNLIGCNNQDKKKDQSNKFDIYGKTWMKLSDSGFNDKPIPNDIIITTDSIFHNMYLDGKLDLDMSFREKIVEIKADTLFLEDEGGSKANLIFNPVTPDSIIVKVNISNSKNKEDNWSELWIPFPFEERFFKGLLPTNDEALLELTKWKEKKDLELITQKEYNLKLEVLKPYIK
jgi:uncharacterized lipoprotein NlpE involved in copper resistance